MKESYVEGLASYGGPESCVHAREGVGEALTGVRAGRVLSREIHAPRRELRDDRGAEAVELCRRPYRCSRGSNPDGEAAADPARSETPRTRGNIAHGNREIPLPAAAARESLAAARIVKPKGTRR
jgi:hypothetical protein